MHENFKPTVTWFNKNGGSMSFDDNTNALEQFFVFCHSDFEHGTILTWDLGVYLRKETMTIEGKEYKIVIIHRVHCGTKALGRTWMDMPVGCVYRSFKEFVNQIMDLPMYDGYLYYADIGGFDNLKEPLLDLKWNHLARRIDMFLTSHAYFTIHGVKEKYSRYIQGPDHNTFKPEPKIVKKTAKVIK